MTWAFFASVMIKIGGNFLFCLSSRSMLHFKDQALQLAQRETWDFSFTDGSAGQNILTLLCGLMKYLNIVILVVGLILWLESFPDTSKVIQLFQIQIQSKNYIAKYNANTETESCLNLSFCHCYQPKPMWRRNYATYNVEFVAAIEEWTWSDVQSQLLLLLRIIGSTISLVGSGRRSIVPATNGSQRVGGCNPLLTCGPTVTCSPKTEPKAAI